MELHNSTGVCISALRPSIVWTVVPQTEALQENAQFDQLPCSGLRWSTSSLNPQFPILTSVV